MKVKCDLCKQEFSDSSVLRHQEMCKKYHEFIKKNVTEHSKSGKQHETFTCRICDKELPSQRGLFLHISTKHFKGGVRFRTCTKSEETQGTKVVNYAVCVKCSQRFIVSKAKANSPKICHTCQSDFCSASNALQNDQPFVALSPMDITQKEKPKKQSSVTADEEEVFDVASEDYNSSDDNYDYLDGELKVLTHFSIKHHEIIKQFLFLQSSKTRNRIHPLHLK